MKKILFTFTILFAFAINSDAQKSAKETKGDQFYDQYSFDKAIESYETAKDLSVEGLRKLAESYRHLDKNLEAKNTYSKFINYSGVATAEDFYNYAMVLKANGNYDEVATWMDKFKELKPNDLRAKNYADNNSELTNLQKDKGKYKVSHLDINTDAEDFGPSFYKNKIVFASSRETPKIIKKEYNWNRKPFLDIYVADVVGDQLKNPQIFSDVLNGKMHEGPASFSNEGNFMAFTRNNYTDASKDGVVKLQIYFSTYKDGKWTAPEPFYLNNREYSVGHPCLTSDGNTMYFVSDMPGGFGGADIYRILKDSKGVWGKPENLGNKINTEGDEMFPFFEENSGALFFSSNGHLGLGGLDNFGCFIDGDHFGKVYNFGYPINTQYDDFALIINDKFSKGYFSSNRSGGAGDDDIYSFEILKGAIDDLGKRLKGVAKDNEGNLLANTFVQLIDNNGNLIDTLTTKSDGAFKFFVQSDKEYKLTGTKSKYTCRDSVFNTSGKEKEIKADIVLSKNEPIGKSLKGIVKDKAGKPIPNSIVKLVDEEGKEIGSVTVKKDGTYKFLVESDMKYKLLVSNPAYLSRDSTVSIFGDRKEIKADFVLLNKEEIAKQIKVGIDLGNLLQLNPIYYDLDKYDIRPDSKNELDKIVSIMNDYPDMVIELVQLPYQDNHS